MNSARSFLVLVALVSSGIVTKGAPPEDLVAASIGVWQAKSPDGRVTTQVTYEDRGQGTVVATIQSPDQAGNLVVTMYYTFKLDGKEYPLSGKNQQGIGSIVHRRADEDTMDYDIKVDGKVTTRGSRALSKDRRTMTLASRDGTRPPIILKKEN